MGTGSSANSPFNFDAAGNLKTTGPSVGGSTSVFTLLSNASADGAPATGIPGGTYIWDIQGTFGGASAALKVLGPDGATYLTVATVTAEAQMAIDVGDNSTMFVDLTGGTPSALYSTLRRV